MCIKSTDFYSENMVIFRLNVSVLEVVFLYLYFAFIVQLVNVFEMPDDKMWIASHTFVGSKVSMIHDIFFLSDC